MAKESYGIEIQSDIIDLEGIDNRITGSVTARELGSALAVGVENAELGDSDIGYLLELNGGSDRVIGAATAIGAEEAFADGIRNAGSISLGSQSNIVAGTGRAKSSQGELTFATGINSSGAGTIAGVGESDSLRGNATAIGRNDVGAFGVLLAMADMGCGQDRLRGNAIANGISSTDARGVSIGLSDIDDDTTAGNPLGVAPTVGGTAQTGTVLMGQGSDVIDGNATVKVAARDGDEIFFAGANGIVNDGGTNAVQQLGELCDG
ncbi:MAG: hypothetical protein AAF974_07525, partial [Cyanobacteria bacterium P01_E01_bin.34]